MGLKRIPFSWHHSSILDRAYWAVSKHVLISVLLIVMTIPFAYPMHQIWLHNIGDNIPPWGQPLNTLHCQCVSSIAISYGTFSEEKTDNVHYWSCKMWCCRALITTSGRVRSMPPECLQKTDKELFDLSNVRFSFVQSWFRAESVEFVSSISKLSGVK